MSEIHGLARQERGQTTILMAGIVIVVFAIAMGLALFGRAAVDRARARTAADAIALATAGEPAAVTELESWYGTTGAVTSTDTGQAWAGVGDSQAASWAATVADEVSAAPAVRAVIERAAQVLGAPLGVVRVDGTDFWFAPSDAARFERVAADFGACPIAASDSTVQFTLC